MNSERTCFVCGKPFSDYPLSNSFIMCEGTKDEPHAKIIISIKYFKNGKTPNSEQTTSKIEAIHAK